MKQLFIEIKESFFLALGNHLPRLNFFNQYRYILFKKAGVQINGYCNFWSGFDVRPIGACKKLIIEKNVFINRNFRCAIPKNSTVIIGENTAIGPNVSIETASHNLYFEPEKGRGTFAKSVNIKEKCWIGANCVILGGVTIGRNSVIGAGSIVINDIPDYSLAVGIPAKVIRKLK